jgi:hypothetical protein
MPTKWAIRIFEFGLPYKHHEQTTTIAVIGVTIEGPQCQRKLPWGLIEFGAKL